MKFKDLMIAKATVCVVFGPILLFAPVWFLNLVGLSHSSGAALLAGAYGASLIGHIILTWRTKSEGDSNARRAILWHLFVYDGIGLIISLKLVFAGTLNVLGWGIVAIYLFFTFYSGLLLATGKKESKEAVLH